MIKEYFENLLKNKRGQTANYIIVIMILIIVWVLFIGLYAYSFHQFVIAININESIGQVNLADVVGLTLGKVDTALLSSLDWLGISLIFGCIIGLFLSAYWLSGSSPKLYLIMDIVILVLAFILSVYIAIIYKEFLNSIVGIDTFTEYMPKTSKFILNLPLFIGVIGAITFILYYSGIPKSVGDSPQSSSVNMPDFQ